MRRLSLAQIMGRDTGLSDGVSAAGFGTEVEFVRVELARAAIG